MASELDTYIVKAREKKIPDEEIRKTLLATGWPADQVNAAFSQETNTNTLIPPPPPVPQVGMWTGFVYTIFFISLYVLATSTANILHVLVDNITIPPEPFRDYYDSGFFSLFHNTTMISVGLAAIIVSYPIFAILAILLKRQLSKKPYVRNLRSRKLLIYITLVGTFLIMLGHLISTIFNFLVGSGTLTTVGHLGVTLLIAGLIFGYFLSEVKNDNKN